MHGTKTNLGIVKLNSNQQNQPNLTNNQIPFNSNLQGCSYS